MKKLCLIFLLNGVVFSLLAQTPGADWRDKIAPEVRAAIDRGEAADVIVVFKEQADLHAAKALPTKAEKARFVFKQLQKTAGTSQLNALKLINEVGVSANTLFLVNALAIEKAGATLLQRLAKLPEISAITADPWINFEGPEPSLDVANSVTERNDVTWGVAKIKAPEVWNMGYTGQGISVGGADTGYDWHHPALQSKYRGWTGEEATSVHDYNWHDAIHEISPLDADSLTPNPCGLNALQPCDDRAHGTHTMGTMIGSEGENLIGVAPDAKWIGCRNMERNWGKPSSYIECFQWFLAPTDLGGQNANPELAPHVINNSWYCSIEEGCTDQTVNALLRGAIINLKTSGVVVVVSNGNAGPFCSSGDNPPAYFEESFSVGATDIADNIAGFSSRGPVLIDGSHRIKPNVSAPGVDVRSSTPNGNYLNFDGTSMAGPHVVGLVALMLSANPELAGHVDEIEDIVEQTAVFIADTLNCGDAEGTDRPNHAYGWGRIDALGAVQAALQWSPPVNTASPALVRATVSPNPFQEACFFTFENLKGEAVLEILDVSGQRVFAQKWLGQGHEVKRISLEDQAPGVYFWKLKSGAGTASGKILKQ